MIKLTQKKMVVPELARDVYLYDGDVRRQMLNHFIWFTIQIGEKYRDLCKTRECTNNKTIKRVCRSIFIIADQQYVQ